MGFLKNREFLLNRYKKTDREQEIKNCESTGNKDWVVNLRNKKMNEDVLRSNYKI